MRARDRADLAAKHGLGLAGFALRLRSRRRRRSRAARRRAPPQSGARRVSSVSPKYCRRSEWPDDRAVDAELAQHRRGDLAREGALSAPSARSARDADSVPASACTPRRARCTAGRRRRRPPRSASRSARQNSRGLGRPLEHLPVACDEHVSSGIAATPGSSLPSSSSSEAPPPVETHEIRSASPRSLIARTESPPPTTVKPARRPATARATAFVPSANARPLEDAHRPVPEDRLRGGDDAANASASRGRCRGRASRRGARRTASTCVLGVGGERRRGDDVGRQQHRRRRTGSRRGPPRPSSRRSAPRRPAPPRCWSTPSLSSTFAPPETITNGRSTSPSSLPRCASSSSEQQPRVGGQQAGDALGRGVRAMRRAEGVVHVEVAALGELAGEALVVLRLARVEARVLEHVGSRSSRQQLGEPRPRRAPSGTSARSSSVFGRPRCEQTRISRAPPSSSSCSVGSDARMRVSSATSPSFERDVEVGADQDDLPVDVGVADGARQRIAPPLRGDRGRQRLPILRRGRRAGS